MEISFHPFALITPKANSRVLKPILMNLIQLSAVDMIILNNKLNFLIFFGRRLTKFMK